MSPEVIPGGREDSSTPLARGKAFASTDAGRSAGLAGAVITMNILALVFTVVFARVLGASGYGSLASLISAWIVLMVPGSALQIATAREISHQVADGDPQAGASVRTWLGHLALATVAVAIVAVPLRHPIAGLLAVDDVWAAAAVPVTGMIWTMVCVQRGALQGFEVYKLVGGSLVAEAVFRLIFALALVGVGLDVTGAFLGSAASLIAVALVLYAVLGRHLPSKEASEPKPLLQLLAGSRIPVIGLTLLFLLQEAHVIVVKHEATSKEAGSYAVAAVAAKAIIWVAVGLGMYLLPEASRRTRKGVDARPVLYSTLGLIAAAGVPMVLIYAFLGEPLLKAVFGSDLTRASGALPWLGLAMTALALSYLCVQYLLAIGRRTFIPFLALAVLVDVAILASVGSNLTRIATALFVLQAVTAVAMLALSVRRHRDDEKPSDAFLTA